MNIIEKFGAMVGDAALKDPEKARRLLLTGYRLQAFLEMLEENREKKNL